MSKFKTVQTNGRIVAAEGQLRLLSEQSGWLQKVEVRLLNSELNRNGWIYTNLAEHRKLFARTPLLCAYVGDKIADGHNFTMRKDTQTGEEYADFTAANAERIVGYFAKDEDIRLETIDGKEWIVGVGTIFTWYNRQLVEKLKERGSLSVSIETLIDEMHKEGDVEIFTKYQILGTTILNEKVNPAVVGANIKTLQFRGDIQEYTMRIASFDEQRSGLPKQEPQTQKQKQNSEKGEARTMAKVRKIDDLRSLFPAHTVLGVNGQSVALLDEKGHACVYTFRDNETTVVNEQIVEVAANSVFGEGDSAVVVSSDELVGAVQARLDATKTALDKATAENADLTAKINAMTEAEHKRREKLVRDAVNSELAENRECFKGEADIDEHLCDELLTDERVCKYAEMVDCDGNFCGDERARADVNDKCNKAVREAKKERQAKNNSHFDWGTIVEGNPEAGKTSIDKILED